MNSRTLFGCSFLLVNSAALAVPRRTSVRRDREMTDPETDTERRRASSCREFQPENVIVAYQNALVGAGSRACFFCYDKPSEIRRCA
jgi:hypothetical protein